MTRHCITIDEYVNSLKTIEDFVDSGTDDHAERTVAIAGAMGAALGWKESKLKYLRYGARIHDIGKISISPVIFRQSSKLTRAQYASVKKHPEFGYEMIQFAHLPEIINDCVLYHHEHYDGGGYPFGLKGKKIPVSSRIVCIADVWESVNSNRPYRQAMSGPDAITFMSKHSTWFDPELLAMLMKLIRQEVL